MIAINIIVGNSMLHLFVCPKRQKTKKSLIFMSDAQFHRNVTLFHFHVINLYEMVQSEETLTEEVVEYGRGYMDISRYSQYHLSL